jgi:hypothetical protein
MAKVYEIPEELIVKREKQNIAEEDGGKPGDYDIELPVKCGGCNWETLRLYVHAGSQKEAEEIFMANDGGMCGECMTRFLVGENKEV